MIRAIIFMCFLATSVSAQELDLSGGGAATRIETSPASSVRLPTEAWTAGASVNALEGAIRRAAYQFPGSTRTTLQLINPARAALQDAGYKVVFSCADAACGGFDFRFQLDLLPEPDMHVDLGNFRYLLMEKTGARPHTVSLVASNATDAGFLHVTEISDAAFSEPVINQPVDETPSEPVPAGDLTEELQRRGYAVLDDLEFETGSTDLGTGPFSSLGTLAAWLGANPTARIVLVGHTDAVGSLEANTSLSRRRAAAVADRLVTSFGTDRAQLQSAGAGYLSPVASNLTSEGRAANRRVEVVLLSLE